MFKTIALSKNIYILCLVIIVAVVLPFNYMTMNGEYSQWILPYFSGAENTSWFGAWNYSIAEQEDFINTSRSQKILWKFLKYEKEDLSQYDYNDIGYLYIVKLARTIFPYLPGILAVMVLQVFMHLLVCWFFIFSLKNMDLHWSSIYLFIIFYSANPFILYYITSPFYFSWQVLPSLLWIAYFSFIKFKSKPLNLLIVLFVGVISFLLRPTTVLPILALFFMLIWNINKRIAIVSAFFLLSFFYILFPRMTSKLPWHPMYVGLGAYGGFGVSSLSDNVSYDLFLEKTGHTIHTNIPGYSWHDKSVRAEFYKIIKTEYIRLVYSKPILVARNSIFNVLQGAGFGHRPYNIYINILSSLMGTFILLIIVLSKKYIIFIVLLVTQFGYSLYFPPIPAYNFGMYILNIFSVLYCGPEVLNKIKLIFGKRSLF